jgi:hypothetical protein
MLGVVAVLQRRGAKEQSMLYSATSLLLVKTVHALSGVFSNNNLKQREEVENMSRRHEDPARQNSYDTVEEKRSPITSKTLCPQCQG